MKDNAEDTVKKFEEAINRNKAKNKELALKREALQEKKLIVDDHKYTNEIEKINQNKIDIERAKHVNVGIMTDEEIVDTQTKNKIYLEGAKNGMLFLNEAFRNFIPFWAGNIILVGARTGGGKSSATANLILSTMTQKNPLTAENRKILTISCEETPLQVYNRLTCLVKGYDYDEQETYTEEQKKDLIDFSGKWPKMGITVIGDDGHGRTDTLEGIKSIFENLINSKTHYDLILIDYIQKIVTSKANHHMKSFDVLKAVMSTLDYYKNVYPAAIVVMTQLSSQNNGDPEDRVDFQDRLRGSKDIITPCTVALEMIPDFKNLKTRWVVHKNRYKGSTVGKYKDTAYDRGMFKILTDEWEAAVAAKNEMRSWAKSTGKSVFDNEEIDNKKE